MREITFPLRSNKNISLFVFQAQDSASLSEEVRTQLEQVQQRLRLVREEVVENSISREKESFNARRAQVTTHTEFKTVHGLERQNIVQTHN